MPGLKVLDEGGFWESNDAVELKRRIEALGAIVKGLGSALENAFMDTVVDKNDPDALADFIERVAQGFHAKKEAHANDGED